jgi:hypothetical protein
VVPLLPPLPALLLLLLRLLLLLCESTSTERKCDIHRMQRIATSASSRISGQKNGARIL